MNFVVQLQPLRKVRVLHKVKFPFGYGEVTPCRDRKQVRLLVFVAGELVWTQRCGSVYEAEPIIRRVYDAKARLAA